MATFDETARQACKVDGVGLTLWLERFADALLGQLEDWGVRESQYTKSIEAKGEVRARRADILRLLQFRLGTPAPEPIRLAIEGTNDLGTLDRWFDAALSVTSWTGFQAALVQG
jgi:hypothetical protein